MKNPKIISIQRWLLRKKFGKNRELPFNIQYSDKKDFYASCYNNYSIPRLVENKKKSKSFFKIVIIIVFLITIISLFGVSTNKDSQGLSSAAAYSEPWLSERIIKWVV
jgi:hypothetical protein